MRCVGLSAIGCMMVAHDVHELWMRKRRLNDFHSDAIMDLPTANTHFGQNRRLALSFAGRHFRG